MQAGDRSLKAATARGDHFPDASSVYGGAWDGPIFVLTHHPEDAKPADGVTFLNCGPAEAVPLGGNLSLTRIPPTVVPTPCWVVRGGTNASPDWLMRNHPVGVRRPHP
jgi:hypothetical protein